MISVIILMRVAGKKEHPGYISQERGPDPPEVQMHLMSDFSAKLVAV